MHPIVHLAVTSAATLEGRRRLGALAPLFWVGGVLADIDHLAWHVQLTGALDLAGAWRHFRQEGRKPRPSEPLPLHEWPLIASGLLLARYSPPLGALAAGLALHRALDDVDDLIGPWCRSRATRRKAGLHRNVFQRAGWHCELCGAKDVRLHAHHVVQRENGGRDELENLVGLCGPCHRLAHEMPANGTVTLQPSKSSEKLA